MSPSLADESIDNHQNDVDINSNGSVNGNNVILKQIINNSSNNNNHLLNNNNNNNSNKDDIVLNQFLNTLIKLKENGIDETDTRFKSLLQLAQLYYNSRSLNNADHYDNGLSQPPQTITTTITTVVTTKDNNINNNNNNKDKLVELDSSDKQAEAEEDVEMLNITENGGDDDVNEKDKQNEKDKENEPKENGNHTPSSSTSTTTTTTTTASSGANDSIMTDLASSSMSTTTTTTTNTSNSTTTTTTTVDSIEVEPMSTEQIGVFKAELDSFKYLSRNLPMSTRSIYEIASNLPYDSQQTHDIKFHPKGLIKLDSLQQPNPDIPETNKGLYEAVQSIHEREDRINSKIHYRLEELKELPANILPELKTSSLIEMKQLKVLSVQKKVRSDIVSELASEIYLNSVHQEIDMFVRPIPRAGSKQPSDLMYDVNNTQLLPDSVFSGVQQRKKFFNALFAHHKDFKEFHIWREKCLKNVLKSIARYHKEKERREQERLAQIRIRLLREGDNEGYRELLARTKNERLEVLLSQTDTLLEKIDFLVQKEKIDQEEKALKERERTEKEEEENARKEGGNLNGTSSADLSTTSTPPTTTTDESEKDKDNVDTNNNNNNNNNGDSTTTSTTTTTTATPTTPATTTTSQPSGTVSTTITKRANINKIEIVKEQPEVMSGGKLKEYQITGLQWLVNLYNNKLNGILADEMGLGKTVQTISLICYLFERKVLEPYLIVAPLSTISNWESEFARWAPKLPVIIYRGKPDERKLLAKRIPRNGFIVVITSFEYIIADKQILSRHTWCYIIIDEGHRIKNKSAKLSVQLRQYHSKNRLLLTGTPLQNDLGELWSLLNFLLPNIFNSLDTFEQWFNAPFANTKSAKANSLIKVNEEESLIIINRLHQVLRYFLLRRLKKDVESQLPEKKERVIKCNLSAMQICMYRSIAEYGQLPMDPNSEIYKKSKTKMRGFNNVVKQLQKVSNHPYLFLTEWDINEDLIRASGKFDMMDQILIKMKASGHRVLIFTQMTEIINIMVEYFSIRDWGYLRLDGSTKPEERSRLVVEWNRKDSPYFIFVLSTHAGGLGMNLQTADTVIIFDSDWNPQMDLQAQDRCHRVGQVNRVNVFRLISASTIEERILERATDKLDLDAKIIQAGMFNTYSNDQERRAKLEEFLHGFPNNTTDEVPTDLEEVNRLISRDDEEFQQFQEMDAELAKNEKKSPKKKSHKSRLMSEQELPEWMLRNPVEEEEVTPAHRRRSIINADAVDDLTEIQFAQMVEMGMSIPEYKDYINNRKIRNKKKKEMRRKRGRPSTRGEGEGEGEEEEDDDDDDDDEDDDDEEEEEVVIEEENSEPEVKVPRKRGRPPKRAHKEIVQQSARDDENTGDEEKAGDDDSGNTVVDETAVKEEGEATHTPGRRGRKKLKPDTPNGGSPTTIPRYPPAPTPKSGRGRGRPPKVDRGEHNVVISHSPSIDQDKSDNHVVEENASPLSPTRSNRKLTFTINNSNKSGNTIDQPISPGSPTSTTTTTNNNKMDVVTPDNGTPYKPRRASAASNNTPLSPRESSNSSSKPTAVVDPSTLDDQGKMQLVWDRVRHAKERTRKLSTIFLELPGRDDYPDYYKEISNPISMSEIKEKKYSTPKEFAQDWKLMFDNALIYNDPSSQVYKDALTLYNNIFASSMKELFNDIVIEDLNKI
ncbi:SNF2-related domain-containing protein [Heterostelium album PN500]|uniref:SNF2-related domain-containing protein n=1 Tax=Heterostelium pallidum (strain ATCC 26659 / Pp 5 / PN500) TaxID=670386 RepID=D3AY78_HETP5|nr:SNF2-related domain-containing protein [Heterostelium album PN500]EFA85905.1 SNF2-related domain-containing protein [Heterostelium album PN500]|eukprot:XP_020438011.1 SNF2-related domain-containing protein [Heterostelium album PN500]